MTKTFGFFCSAVIFLSLVWTVDNLAVMSVDLGTEFMKIAIVKPGVPMEIALNKFVVLERRKNIKSLGSFSEKVEEKHR